MKQVNPQREEKYHRLLNEADKSYAKDKDENLFKARIKSIDDLIYQDREDEREDLIQWAVQAYSHHSTKVPGGSMRDFLYSPGNQNNFDLKKLMALSDMYLEQMQKEHAQDQRKISFFRNAENVKAKLKLAQELRESLITKGHHSFALVARFFWVNKEKFYINTTTLEGKSLLDKIAKGIKEMIACLSRLAGKECRGLIMHDAMMQYIHENKIKIPGK